MMNQISHFSNNGSNGNGSLKRVVVLHRQGCEWRLLRMSRDEKDARIVLDDDASIGVSDVSGLRRWLTAAEADLMVQILPGGTVVCRTLQIPKMTSEGLAEVLDLQAEAVLPAGIEGHRRAVTLLPWSQDLADEFEALAFGWPGAAPGEIEAEELEFRYAPTVAGLTEVLCRAHGNAFAAYLDRDAGTFELLMHHQGRTGVRTIRIDTKSTNWVEQLDQAFVETGLSIGMATDDLSEWRGKLRDHAGRYAQMPLINDEAREQLGKQISGGLMSLDMEWWKKFGLAVMAGTGLFGPRRRLFELLAERPEEKRNPLAVLFRWVDEPSRAALVLLIAVLVLALVPLGSSWARRMVLGGKIGNAAEVEELGIELANQAQYYKFLDEKRWPMTKLIADISGSAPYVVQIDEMMIDSESKVVRLKGKAPTNSDLAVFRGALEGTGMFDQISVPRAESKFQKVEFEMTFRVVDPMRKVERAFTESLAVNLYGDADGDAAAEGGGDSGTLEALSNLDEKPAAVTRGSTSAVTRPTTSRVNPVAQKKAKRDAAKAKAGGIPAALTLEAIEAMDYQEAWEATKAIAGRMYDRTLDPATKTRLRDEYVRLANRITELKKSTGDGS